MIARALLAALLLCWPFAAAADVAVPPLSGRVVDQTGTLSASDAAALTQRLKDLETRKGSQVAVLIVPTTQPETIEQFSIRVAEAWKIGRKKIDDGALLVVAKNDHKLRIEVGYGLEGALTDVTARRIIDEIIAPQFKTGDFTGGISAGVDRIIRIIDGEPLPAPKPEVSHSVDPDMAFNIIFSPFGFIGFLAIAGISRGLFGRLLGSGVTAGVIGAVFWFLLGSIAVSVGFSIFAFILTLFGDAIMAASQAASRNAGRGGSGWSTGSSGSSWSSGSSSGSSDSGFSGGGGSFGGGGASGSW
ncbi:TPM domain-containing protein [Bradyrhizobium sp.]|jgi:uncharacterized protein|uniref:TPM domain-containing protein n=1 Tax=Bradyrhizobium sp. TaxID=376 RepID=UPI003C132786